MFHFPYLPYMHYFTAVLYDLTEKETLNGEET